MYCTHCPYTKYFSGGVKKVRKDEILQLFHYPIPIPIKMYLNNNNIIHYLVYLCNTEKKLALDWALSFLRNIFINYSIYM